MDTATAPVLGPIGDLARHAAIYAEAGLEVFPVNPTNKRPLASQYDATTHPDTIAGWWERWPQALIGHRLAEDHVIFDVDPRHGGYETWQALKEEVGGLPETRAHASGREDGGGHVWFLRPSERLSIVGFDRWAEERQLGEAAGETRWVCGIDILHRNHRYTILPPSPHPDTGKPYTWLEGHGLDIGPAPMPALLADLITAEPPPPPAPPKPPDPDSIADWYSQNHTWSQLLARHGWQLRAGDGNRDGSRWRHPTATGAHSATIRHGCLFVYSPNTDFDVTEPQNPHGYTLFRAWATLEWGGDMAAAARAARELKDGPTANPNDLSWIPNIDIHVAPNGDHNNEMEPGLIDWVEFWAADVVGEDWLCEPLVARGRQTALWARHKTGKSLLTLEVAAALATGRRCLHQGAGDPSHVMYVDYEMTVDDLTERLTDLGYGPDDNLEQLHYYLIPPWPPLDTPEGGHALIEAAVRHQVSFVVVDTMARAVQGEENSADTYRAFYRCTGMALKALGISLLRLDHAGKDVTRGQRGSSAKGDDVDVVFELRPGDQGVELVRKASRMSWVPEQISLARRENPLRHVPTPRMWPEGTDEIARLLDELDVEVEASANRAAKALRDAGHKARNETIRAAVQWRRLEEERLKEEAS